MCRSVFFLPSFNFFSSFFFLRFFSLFSLHFFSFIFSFIHLIFFLHFFFFHSSQSTGKCARHLLSTPVYFEPTNIPTIHFCYFHSKAWIYALPKEKTTTFCIEYAVTQWPKGKQRALSLLKYFEQLKRMQMGSKALHGIRKTSNGYCGFSLWNATFCTCSENGPSLHFSLIFISLVVFFQAFLIVLWICFWLSLLYNSFWILPFYFI